MCRTAVQLRKEQRVVRMRCAKEERRLSNGVFCESYLKPGLVRPLQCMNEENEVVKEEENYVCDTSFPSTGQSHRYKDDGLGHTVKSVDPATGVAVFEFFSGIG